MNEVLPMLISFACPPEKWREGSHYYCPQHKTAKQWLCSFSLMSQMCQCFEVGPTLSKLLIEPLTISCWQPPARLVFPAEHRQSHRIVTIRCACSMIMMKQDKHRTTQQQREGHCATTKMSRHLPLYCFFNNNTLFTFPR